MSPGDWLDLWRWGDLSPDEKPHLRYASVWRWVRAEGVWLPLPSISDPTERERRQREYTELWRYLFVTHLAGLSEEEQQAFRDRRHPSQSHDLSAEAEPVAEQLRLELAARGIVAEVSVAHYLDGRTVLDVPLPEWPLDGQWPDDLSFFRGYEVQVCKLAERVSSPDRRA
jgi:hypothetical protein